MSYSRMILAFAFASLSIHCSQSGTAGAPASASNDVTATDGRLEIVCNVGGGKVVELQPSFGEIHRIDMDRGTWSMDDGLTMRSSGADLHITDDEGTEVATVVNHVYKESAVQGSCEDFIVKDVKPTSAAFTLDNLEYDCDLGGGRSLLVRPSFGEIDEIDVNKGTFLSRDGMSFTLKSLESIPPKNEISGVDDEGSSVGALVEDDKGATWSNGTETGACKKTQRARK